MALFYVQKEKIDRVDGVEFWIKSGEPELVDGTQDEADRYIQKLSDDVLEGKYGNAGVESYLNAMIGLIELSMMMNPLNLTSEQYKELQDLKDDLEASNEGTLDITKYQRVKPRNSPTIRFKLIPVKVLATIL